MFGPNGLFVVCPTDRGHVRSCRRSGERARKEQTPAGGDGGHAPRHPEHVNTSRKPYASALDSLTRIKLTIPSVVHGLIKYKVVQQLLLSMVFRAIN